MRFILGIIVGVVLLLGTAYLHDTRIAKPGGANQFVNWDMVIGLIGK